MKKFLNILALSSLLVSGAAVSQANATTPFVAPDNLAGAYSSFSFASTDTTTINLGEGSTGLSISQVIRMTDEFLLAHAGEALSVSAIVTDPQGTILAKTDMPSATKTTYSTSTSGWLNGSGGWVSINWTNYTLTVPANPTGYSGELDPEIYLNAASSAVDRVLPAGTYTVEIKVLAGGQAVTSQAGLTFENLEGNATVDGTNAVTPVGTTYSSTYARLCADPEKISANDQLKAELYLDGVLKQSSSFNWNTRSATTSGQTGYRNGEYGDSTTVTAFDDANGLYVSASLYGQQFAAGSTHDLSYKLYNSATSADVSGDCAPAAPPAPTISYFNSLFSLSGTLGFGSESNAKCYLFDKSAPTVVVSSTWGFTMGSSSFTCSLSGTKSGHTYFAKTRSSFWSTYSDYSAASNEVLIPAAGYTVTSQHAGVVGAGKIVKVNDNSIPIEDLSSYTSSTSDGKGGLFTYASSTSCTMTCQLNSFRIRHMSATTIDSTFGGTGEIVLNSFTPNNASAFYMGYFGTSKDKWVVPVTGYESNLTDQKVQLIFGTSSSSATTSKEITKSAFNAACQAGADGYTLKPNLSASVSVVSTPTANPYLLLTCWKTFTLADLTQQWSSTGVLVSVNPATGALTPKTALGTPSANANGFSVRTTVNPDATGSQPLITAFVTSFKYTAYNSMSMSFSGTVADHSIIRIAADGTVAETTGAWGTTGGSSSTEPYVYIPGINSGSIFGLLTTGSNYSMFKTTATGVSAAPLTVVTTGSSIMMPRISTMNGYAISGTETKIPVSVSGMNELAAGWIDTTTGALTVGEKMTYTSTPGNGSATIWLNGNDKNTYLLLSSAAAPSYLTVYKWIDSRYTVPTGPVPTVTSKTLKYAKNTPAAGTKVTLTGTNLNGVTSAKIGGVTAALGTKSATSLVLTVPNASAAGSADIVLTTANGDTTVDTFTYIGNGIEQDILIGAVASPMFVGGADLALSGTATFSPSDAGTGGAVTWSSDTPTICSIVSGKAHFLSAGVCRVTATAAASGLLLAGSRSTQTTVLASAQTITLTGPTNLEVDLDGVDLVASTTSGLPLTFATSTSGVCSVDSLAHVTAITTGDCVVTASQAGNGGYTAATQSLTITFVAAATTPIVDNGNPALPTVVGKTGTWVTNGDTSISWNRAKGALNFKLNVVYIGPIKATGVFKVGSKSYTCVVNFGTLKKQATSKRLTLTSPNLCSAANEKAQLAALKKAAANTVVKITFVRDMRLPTTYAKIRTKTRVIYAKLG